MNNLKPTEENCDLVAIKKSKDGVIKIMFAVERKEGDRSFIDKTTMESAEYPHPDLNNALKELKPILMYSFGKNDFIQVLDEGAKDISEGLRTRIKGLLTEVLKADYDRVTIIGLTVAGVDENKGIIISGKYETANGQNVALNSPRIKFDDSAFGEYSQKAEELYEYIKHEAYNYMWEHKRAQLDIAFEEDK